MNLKKLTTAIGLTGGISYLAYKKISEEMFNNVFLRRDKEDVVDEKYLEWLSKSNVKQIKINSFDGLKLNAYCVENNDTNKYVILVHGIWSSKKFNYPRAYEFDQRGFNTLIIDQRAAGDSEGKYYTYGQKESLDLLLWINYLINKNKNVQIILYGISMGAATVMMSCANKLPKNVKCIIEDCGYSSIYEEFDHVVQTNYKIKYTKPILMLLEKEMIDRFGMRYSDVSVKTVLESNEVPIMFIHGNADDFVPFEMSKRLYNHNKGYKKFYPIAGAKHTEAINDEKYFDNIVNFIQQFVE